MSGIRLGADPWTGLPTRLMLDVPAFLGECGLRLSPLLMRPNPAAAMAREMGLEGWLAAATVPSEDGQEALVRIGHAIWDASGEWLEPGGYKAPATEEGQTGVRARLRVFVTDRVARGEPPFDVLEVAL